MMVNSLSWAAPLLMLPGVALLILSTASRYARIHDELHHWEGRERNELAHTVLENLRWRARAFRNALVSLYLSIMFFVIAGLSGALTQRWPEFSANLVVSMAVAASGALLFASSTLMREAILSLDVIDAHFKRFESKTAP